MDYRIRREVDKHGFETYSLISPEGKVVFTGQTVEHVRREIILMLDAFRKPLLNPKAGAW